MSLSRRGFLKSLLAVAATLSVPASAVRLVAARALALPEGAIVELDPGHGVYVVKTGGGFLPLDGRTVSRSDYAALFATIGAAYGQGCGDGETFTVPDLRR